MRGLSIERRACSHLRTGAHVSALLQAYHLCTIQALQIRIPDGVYSVGGVLS